MAKINRYDGNLAAFASQADTNRRTTFGTETTGDNTLDGNLNADFFTGWQIVGPNEFPTLEDFNAAFFTIGQLMAYVHQVGMPEWNGSQEYHIGSMVNRAGVVYICTTNNHTSVTPPESDATNWRLPASSDSSYDNTSSGLTATTPQAAIDEVEGRVDTLEGDASTYALKENVGNVVLVDALSTTFTNSTNNIASTGVGVGVEVGDVISVSGSVNNDTEYTIEVITDANNVIVNQAHAGGTTTKSLTDETATVTVTLLCKWFLAPIGLGKGWIAVTANRSAKVDYAAPFNIFVSVQGGLGGTGNINLFVDNVQTGDFRTFDVSGNLVGSVYAIVPKGSVFKLVGEFLVRWSELR